MTGVDGVVVRAFSGRSTLRADEGGGQLLSLALAPALTPHGLVASPSFFSGFATHPQVLARCLVTLADITATRYFKYVPDAQRDPVLTAHGDRLRAEVFSACNSVHARLDLLGSGVDGGEIGFGTTNVDITATTRAFLSGIGRGSLLHLDIGAEGLSLSTPDATQAERPVVMPPRWVRAFGNAAEIHHGLVHAFTVPAAGARAFVAALPPATAGTRSGWLTPSRTGVSVGARRQASSVHVSGLHRLSAVKRLLTHVTAMSVYGPTGADQGPALVQFDLPGARLSVGLTDEAWRGFSGEGALLTGMAGNQARDDAEALSSLLGFESSLDVAALSARADLTEARGRAALAMLAASGIVGWDAADESWFHRELPHDAELAERTNPRLRGARRLVEQGAVRSLGSDRWSVAASGTEATAYPVALLASGAWQCACPWYLAHTGTRGPCKHVLAVQLTLTSESP